VKSLLSPAGRWSLLRPVRPGTTANLDPTSSQRTVGPSALRGARRLPVGEPRSPAHGKSGPASPGSGAQRESAAQFAARQLLRRYGLLQRRLLEREKLPVPWRDVVRACRHLELRGEVRGGRFVAGLSGEQYALPEAVELLRSIRKRQTGSPLWVSASDPLNLHGILTPSPRISAQSRNRIQVAT
jgi:ATP-dependent helicase Lhr and Lhr-like helicase